ncbi:MAG: RsmD family RNA methyltransferase [Planctomycetes bacterium]|nr:RsmD family RNA methyltransferase [Planctomycetota bacterium]
MPRRRPKPEPDETGGTIRISSGELRGRQIDCPQTGGVRPMLSRTRMALFNLIRERLKNAVVWDCFAGSGLLGIEALSQGADYCVFVERDAPHARVVQANLRALGLGDRSNLIRGSVFDLVKPGIPRLPHTPAGLILLDPPHAMFADRESEFWPWLRTLRETALMDANTTIAIGHPAELTVPEEGGLRVTDSRIYGTVAFTLLTA